MLDRVAILTWSSICIAILAVGVYTFCTSDEDDSNIDSENKIVWTNNATDINTFTPGGSIYALVHPDGSIEYMNGATCEDTLRVAAGLVQNDDGTWAPRQE